MFSKSQIRISKLAFSKFIDNLADTYACGDTDGVTGCKSDAHGINVVCHCDTELCNVFQGAAGRNVVGDSFGLMVGSMLASALMKYF